MALDIASQLGWAVGRPGEQPRYGSVLLTGKGAADGALLAAMSDWLGDQLTLHKPKFVAYEAPLPGGQQVSINAAKIALRLSGVVELVCWRRRIRCEGVNVKTVRKMVLGHGNATKVTAALWLEQTMGWPIPKRKGESDFDAVDATVVWAYSVGIRALGAV